MTLRAVSQASTPTGPTFTGGKPYVSATLSTSQSVTPAITTKIAFDTKSLDSGGYFSTTLNRFTPLVAGQYLVNLQMSGSSTLATPNNYTTILEKNGVAISNISNSSGYVGAQGVSASITALVTMNGTTDFLEGYVNFPGTSTVVVGGVTGTVFTAVYIGP